MGVGLLCAGALLPGRILAQESQTPSEQSTPSGNGSEQEATRPPQVTYEHGQLTIIAENASLSEILSDLHRLMGVEVDLGGSAAGERMWVRLGPGPARKILGDLLSGTELNYVIQGAVTDVDGIKSVSLSPKGKGVGPGASDEPSERMATRLGTRANNGSPESDGEPGKSPMAATVPSAGTAAGSGGEAPQQSATDTSIESTTSDSDPSRPPATKTSAQMMQQLQTMYETRRKMQEQQSQQSAPANQ